jgi:hypothetical protein
LANRPIAAPISNSFQEQTLARATPDREMKDVGDHLSALPVGDDVSGAQPARPDGLNQDLVALFEQGAHAGALDREAKRPPTIEELLEEILHSLAPLAHRDNLRPTQPTGQPRLLPGAGPPAHS